MKVFQMTRFKKYVKKLPRHFQQVILDAVENVLTNTEVGEPKKGDLEGIQVYKFTMGRQLIETFAKRPLLPNLCVAFGF